jgi:hypothetical protein
MALVFLFLILLCIWRLYLLLLKLLKFCFKKSDAGWEEYIDYIFPDDSNQSSSLKLLELAKKWKKDIANSAKAN